MGRRCVGTTAAEASWRTTLRKTIYVHAEPGSTRPIRLSVNRSGKDRYGQNATTVFLPGEATISRTVDYQETAGCFDAPTPCPKVTVRVQVSLTGTRKRLGNGNVFGGIRKVPESLEFSCQASTVFPGFIDPFGSDAVRLFPRTWVTAQALPRSRLLDRRRMRVKDSHFVEQPFSGSSPEYGAATLSGNYTDRLAVSLKRLRLKR